MINETGTSDYAIDPSSPLCDMRACRVYSVYYLVTINVYSVFTHAKGEEAGPKTMNASNIYTHIHLHMNNPLNLQCPRLKVTYFL